MNACAFCKKGKRKCDKAKPSCSNCLRLRKPCIYTEDTIETHFVKPRQNQAAQPPLESPNFHLAKSLAGGISLLSHETFQQSAVDFAMQILGSIDNMLAVSTEFFTGTHQRIPALSKFRFYINLESLTVHLRASFAALCLSILLIQQVPAGKMASAQSPLYVIVKNLISSLEVSSDLSLDLAHCRILVTFYEMGHGLHTAAYISAAACARTARALGLHRKTWRNSEAYPDKLMAEEEKRTWWAIVNMDRFIGLCNGDALFATNDPERADPLPIEDLLWSEASQAADLNGPIMTPPSLDSSFSITVGQMARECQISHLAGRVVRHVFDPTPDPEFNAEEAIQLERTLRAYIPLLANEELKIGKYCGAYGVCNSTLLTLYEFMLNRTGADEERARIVECIEETSLRVIIFAEASYGDRQENYPFEILSPYLPYSLCQAGIIQYRLWKHSDDPACKRNLDLLKSILREFTERWMVAFQYLEILENIDQTSASIAIPFQGYFINTGQVKIV